jgi:peptidoglycan/xylan/chitin deacetylase (PgdA/CDA1 family)
MTLLALMYHRAQAGPHGNTPEMLDAHFAHIAQHCRCVRPGERLSADRLNVCLTFDDGYFDFYAIVYPLLKKHALRAVLAVPPVVVHEQTSIPFEARLSSAPDVNYNHPNYGGFCTWTELREMAHSPEVSIAAHGFTHCRLDREGADLHTEIVVPQSLLSSRLDRPIDTFVFPYGRFSPAALSCAQKIYRHAFRIGGADNPDWDRQLLYRVDADRLTSPHAPFTAARRARYRARYLWNRLRQR